MLNVSGITTYVILTINLLTFWKKPSHLFITPSTTLFINLVTSLEQHTINRYTPMYN